MTQVTSRRASDIEREVEVLFGSIETHVNNLLFSRTELDQQTVRAELEAIKAAVDVARTAYQGLRYEVFAAWSNVAELEYEAEVENIDREYAAEYAAVD